MKMWKKPHKTRKVLIILLLLAICFFSIVCGSAGNTPNPTIEKQIGQPEESEIQLVAQLIDSVLESEGGTYYGPALDGVYTGSGEFRYLSGGVYQGEFSNSKREGSGIFTWENGDSFTGTWKDDSLVEGIYTFTDGRTYAGTFQNNQFSDGVYTVASIPAELKLVSFSATLVSGQVDSVCFTTSKGTKYDGQMTGVATIEYASGNKYIGSVLDGVRDGNGTYYWMEKGSVISYYDGPWENGRMSGEGCYHYSANVYPYVKGTFVKGKIDGTAIYYKEAGNTFTSTWRNGVCQKVK